MPPGRRLSQPWFQRCPQLIELLVASADATVADIDPSRALRTVASSSSTPREESFSRKHGQHDGIEDVPGCRGLHPRATALDDRDEALLLDALDRFADDGSTHAEMRAQVAFGRERLPGCDLSGDDGTDQVMNHGAAPSRAAGGTRASPAERMRGRRSALQSRSFGQLYRSGQTASVASSRRYRGRISHEVQTRSAGAHVRPLPSPARVAMRWF